METVPPTLEDLESLPERDRRIHLYIRSIGKRLKPLIEKGRHASALGNTQELAAIRTQYERIRGERGRPERIDEYLEAGSGKGSKGLGVNHAFAEIVQQSRFLSMETILRYVRRYARDEVAASAEHPSLPLGNVKGTFPGCRICAMKSNGDETYYTEDSVNGCYSWNVSQARQYAGAKSYAVPADKLAQLLDFNLIHEEHLDHVNPSEPGILAHVPCSKQSLNCLIDGCHRAARALRDGLVFRVRYLNRKGSLRCLTSYRPPEQRIFRDY